MIRHKGNPNGFFDIQSIYIFSPTHDIDPSQYEVTDFLQKQNEDKNLMYDDHHNAYKFNPEQQIVSNINNIYTVIQ